MKSAEKYGDGMLSRQKISNCINGIEPITPLRARKIELALNLPKNSLVDLTYIPSSLIHNRNMRELREFDEKWEEISKG